MNDLKIALYIRLERIFSYISLSFSRRYSMEGCLYKIILCFAYCVKPLVSWYIRLCRDFVFSIKFMKSVVS